MGGALPALGYAAGAATGAAALGAIGSDADRGAGGPGPNGGPGLNGGGGGPDDDNGLKYNDEGGGDHHRDSLSPPPPESNPSGTETNDHNDNEESDIHKVDHEVAAETGQGKIGSIP